MQWCSASPAISLKTNRFSSFRAGVGAFTTSDQVRLPHQGLRVPHRVRVTVAAYPVTASAHPVGAASSPTRPLLLSPSGF